VYSGSVQREQLRPCGRGRDTGHDGGGGRVTSRGTDPAPGRSVPSPPRQRAPGAGSARVPRPTALLWGEAIRPPCRARWDLAQPVCSQAATETALGELRLQNPRLLCPWQRFTESPAAPAQSRGASPQRGLPQQAGRQGNAGCHHLAPQQPPAPSPGRAAPIPSLNQTVSSWHQPCLAARTPLLWPGGSLRGFPAGTALSAGVRGSCHGPCKRQAGQASSLAGSKSSLQEKTRTWGAKGWMPVSENC